MSPCPVLYGTAVLFSRFLFLFPRLGVPQLPLTPDPVAVNDDWGYSTEPQSHGCHGYAGRRNRWPLGKVTGESAHKRVRRQRSEHTLQTFVNFFFSSFFTDTTVFTL